MDRSPSQKAVLEAIKPPVHDWQSSQTRTAYALLVGASVSLLQCRSILNNLTAGADSPAWEIETLHENIVEALQASDTLNWNYSESVKSWSVGFFLNKAQINIAAALDKCVNAWLFHALNVNNLSSNKEEGDTGLFYPFITTRLQILALCYRGTNSGAEKLLRKLITGFSRCPTTGEAKRQIVLLEEFFRDQNYFPTFDEYFDKSAATPLTHEECVAIVFGRVNAFKHLILDPERSGITNTIEAVLTTKALVNVAALWKKMIETTTKDPSK